MEIPVYLFTGFLGAGKTTFIQDLLEGSDFNDGEKTLLLFCEDGRVKPEPQKFARPNIIIEHITSEKELTSVRLESLQAKTLCERVLIEYNGMWMLDSLFQVMPEDWIIYQEMMFADASTFLMYNQNMRQQTFDKMKTAELVVFNRFRRDMDKYEYHKIVRVANRRSQILYEFGPDEVEADDIEDPLPFDLDAPVVEIKEADYAEWYRDIYDNPENYDGKTVAVKGRVAFSDELPRNKFAFGRHVMTCCVQDIQFAGLACVCEQPITQDNGDWVDLKAQIKIEEEEIYGEAGPVLHCLSLTPCQPADPEVATF